jgi:hypothetical protein
MMMMMMMMVVPIANRIRVYFEYNNIRTCSVLDSVMKTRKCSRIVVIGQQARVQKTLFYHTHEGEKKLSLCLPN